MPEPEAFSFEKRFYMGSCQDSLAFTPSMIEIEPSSSPRPALRSKQDSTSLAPSCLPKRQYSARRRYPMCGIKLPSHQASYPQNCPSTGALLSTTVQLSIQCSPNTFWKRFRSGFRRPRAHPSKRHSPAGHFLLRC